MNNELIWTRTNTQVHLRYTRKESNRSTTTSHALRGNPYEQKIRKQRYGPFTVNERITQVDTRSGMKASKTHTSQRKSHEEVNEEVNEEATKKSTKKQRRSNEFTVKYNNEFPTDPCADGYGAYGQLPAYRSLFDFISRSNSLCFV